jgi:hypothetical protein
MPVYGPERPQHPAAETGVSVASWVFGSILLAFVIAVFAFAPSELPEFKIRILAFSCALLAGLFGFFMTGDIGLRFTSVQTKAGKIVVRATGGLALFVLVLWWWFSSVAPIKQVESSLSVAEQAAKELVAQVSGPVRGAWENSDRSPEDRRKVVEDAPKAAQSLLLLSNDDLKPAWQIVKYEYAQQAFGMSASVWPDTSEMAKSTKRGYAEQCLKAGQKALDIMADAQAKYGHDKELTGAWDFAREEDEQDRVRYFMAICLCRLADVEKSKELQVQAQHWADQIAERFIEKWPINGNDEFTGCIKRP